MTLLLVHIKPHLIGTWTWLVFPSSLAQTRSVDPRRVPVTETGRSPPRRCQIRETGEEKRGERHAFLVLCDFLDWAVFLSLSLSLLVLLLALELTFFSFFYFPTLITFLELETVSAFPPQKKKEEKKHQISFSLPYSTSPPSPSSPTRQGSKTPKHATDIACGLVAHGTQLVYHRIPVPLTLLTCMSSALQPLNTIDCWIS